MTLNGVMAITVRKFAEFGKPVLQKTICGGIYASVYYIFTACTMSLLRKFTFAISSPDEFLVGTASQKEPSVHVDFSAIVEVHINNWQRIHDSFMWHIPVRIV